MDSHDLSGFDACDLYTYYFALAPQSDVWKVAMISLAGLFKLSRHKHVEAKTLNELFSLERSTLITTMLLETILLYILTPLIGNIIIAWYGVIMSLSLWRFYNAYDYRWHLKRNTPLVWHKKFVVQVWLTALLFSGLALFVTPKLDAYYQLFTFIVLIGISSGTIKALVNDHRTAIGYLIIILLPLTIEMVLLMRQDTYILAFLVALYFFVQISVLLHSYELSVAAHETQQEIEKTRELLFEKQEIIQRFFDQTDEAIFLYDRNKKLLDCNWAFEKLFKISAEEAKHYTLENFPDKQWVSLVEEALSAGVDGHLGLYTASQDKKLWLEIRCLAMEDELGGSVGGIGLIKDKTAEHINQQTLAQMALHDPMTGLANRRGFQEYMANMFYDKKHATHVSLFFYMDVNKFKQINDQFGHEMGDDVLVEVAKRLSKLAPKNANLTRLGGDEFCMVIPYVGEKGMNLALEMDTWIEAIQHCSEESFYVNTHTFSLRCSTGAVYIEPGEMDIDKVVAQADISMFQAKRAGSRGVVVYNQSLEQGECQAYEVHHHLRDAIQKEELQIFYQPIVQSYQRTVVAAEALVRWQHPEKGLLVPSDFLPVAVRSGQVTQVDTWVLHGVLEQIAQWKKMGTFSLDYISINVDVQSMIAENFVGDLLDVMAQQGVAGKEIRLELTEFELAENLNEVQEAMRELSRHGVLCIVDDFGTGCLSLFHLKDLPFEAIKIDRIFVQNLTDKIESLFLLKTIIELAQKFRYDIIVKGIESEAQREIVSSLNNAICYQGSLTAQPLAQDEFASLLTPSDNPPES
jgi:diguanylate cyclase (GGDEF)-like protein